VNFSTDRALSRRQFVHLAGTGIGALTLGGALLSACGGDDAGPSTTGAPSSGGGSTAAPSSSVASGDLTTIRSQLSWIPNVEFGAYWIGLEDGLYTAEGVKLDFLSGGPNSPGSAQTIAADGADVAHSDDFVGLMDAILAGNDFVLFAVKMQTSPVGFMWLPDAGITKVQDLIGKKIGSNAGQDNIIDAVFTANGLEPDYTFVPVGFDPQPLIDGEIDVKTCFVTNEPLTLQVQGIDVETVTYTDFGLPQYADVMFAKRSYVEEHRDTIVKYLTATIKGWEANEADPERAAKLSVEKYGVDQGLDLQQQILNNEADIPLMQSPLTKEKGLMRISREVMETQMYPALAAVGRTGLPAVDVLVDESILDDVYQGKNRLTS
jgi:ABC-type nitrate/sulfonate/bicarbonate transport system substrate-binding protein